MLDLVHRSSGAGSKLITKKEIGFEIECSGKNVAPVICLWLYIVNRTAQIKGTSWYALAIIDPSNIWTKVGGCEVWML